MMLGTIVNVLAIVAGTAVGLLLKGRLPERMKTIMIQALGLITIFVGVRMIMTTANPLVVLISLVLGAVLGESLSVERRLDEFGAKVERRVSRDGGTFAKAFITTTLLFCVGPLAILGALEDGLRGDIALLLTKSGLDGVSSVAFAATLGVGVLFSTIPLLLYQGGITAGASMLAPYLSERMINAITATGGLLVIGTALNILEIRKVKVGNMLPAILLAALLAALF